MEENKNEKNNVEAEDGTAQSSENSEKETEEQTQSDADAPIAEDTDTIVLKQQLGEAKEKYLRLYSDFENFRRRTAREKLELTKTAGEKIIIDLLSVIDDFDRAKKAANEAKEPDYKSINDGFELIMTKFMKVLEQQKVAEMKAQGETFNPDFHEAIAQIPAPSEDMKGKIIDVVEKGYLIEDKVIRFAKVVVGS